MNRTAAVLFPICIICMAGAVQGHGGGLNAEGCHNERRTGGYHCHRGSMVPASFAVAPAALRPGGEAANALQQRNVAFGPSRHGGPTCYTGPRGGTYTITASGNKNYSGC